jgi:hypothetical protein
MLRLGPMTTTAALALALALACGGGAEPERPVAVPIFHFSPAGLSPKSLLVKNRACLTFFNDDVVDHQLVADSGPGLDDCPEFNQANAVPAGHDWANCVRDGPRTCRFHDVGKVLADGSPDPAFSGTVRILAP